MALQEHLPCSTRSWSSPLGNGNSLIYVTLLLKEVMENGCCRKKCPRFFYCDGLCKKIWLDGPFSKTSPHTTTLPGGREEGQIPKVDCCLTAGQFKSRHDKSDTCLQSRNSYLRNTSSRLFVCARLIQKWLAGETVQITGYFFLHNNWTWPPLPMLLIAYHTQVSKIYL